MDDDNLRGSATVLLDALKARGGLGLIEDDSPAHIPTPKISPTPGQTPRRRAHRNSHSMSLFFVGVAVGTLLNALRDALNRASIRLDAADKGSDSLLRPFQKKDPESTTSAVETAPIIPLHTDEEDAIQAIFQRNDGPGIDTPLAQLHAR
jgi:hypothetical protein